ncbi:FAD-binding and (Fe-S)-binding domain-containing protein [Brevibacterium sp. 'Marine']|uniref:FAD-binding and (Fe-S)-binding domain-containing protein n=1 Tax=Brevibacterium sp. 'Marine' TaxID=2725563 RepID=UPI002006E4D0|nr:FAD-binding and (Fe-S)-binding domain-containing protein [Brevibacterium sp. 'Marine']
MTTMADPTGANRATVDEDESQTPLPTALAEQFRAAGIRDFSIDDTDRAAYSSDASLFRLVPAAIVFPHDEGEVARVLSVARRLGVPITSRGAGTSIAGNAIGRGIVLDFSLHMNAVLDLDPDEQAAWVQSGCIHAHLQKQAKPHGLRFGPDPSTHTRCTIGGMIGNNACGPRALGYGRTGDNILALKIMLIDGTVVTLDDADASTTFPRLHELVAQNLGTIRTNFGTFSRQVSGYGLESLLPENGFDVRRAFAGTEGTWGVILAAKMRLVKDPSFTSAVVLGYADMVAAAHDAPLLKDFPVAACEGLDSRMLDRVIDTKGAEAVPPLPEGAGWLVVELTGENEAKLEAETQRLISESKALDSAVLDARAAAEVWAIRADGAGLVSRTPDGRDAHAGWEDSAVPVDHLGDYLHDLMELLEEHGLWAIPYGHFGDGCLHMRVDFPLADPNGGQVMRDFMVAATKLVARYGGSVSGEHGDGRARSELLRLMYTPAALDLFSQVKRLFDPQHLLNPGVIVDPDALDESVRLTQLPLRQELPGTLAMAYEGESAGFASAVHRCTGVGKCRADSAAGGGIMCPSYQATRDERHSTRGRARVLQEMVSGELLEPRWDSPEVHEALDLCLSCKACGTECPTGTDMSTYKAEVLYQSYKGKLRPMKHYSLGFLPQLARLITPLAPAVNRVSGLPGLTTLAKKMAGIDVRRSIPQFAATPFRKWWATTAEAAPKSRASAESPGADSSPAADSLPPTAEVVLFADSWSNHFAPRILAAAVAVLEQAGVHVRVIDQTVCCGLPLISTGQLDAARANLSETITALDATGDVPIIGVEPSCLATLKDDSLKLVADEASHRVANRVQTLAQYLLSIGAELPDLSGVEALVQPHCHQSAIFGNAADQELLARAGADTEFLGGCCGLAGNFGVEDGHFETSVAVAEVALLPALRRRGRVTGVEARADSDTVTVSDTDTDTDTNASTHRATEAVSDASRARATGSGADGRLQVVLADGYSCRTQITDLSDAAGVSLAELLAWGWGLEPRR